MSTVSTIIFYTLCAGLCMPLGGLLARIERVRPAWLENELRHGVIAFGGGILVAAVALVLIPEGNRFVDHSVLSVLIFMIGGLAFFGVERYLGARRRDNPQLMAMLLDYVPECIALGGALALEARSAILLALFIGLQNVPEGFNVFREMRAGGYHSASRILWFMFALVPIGPLVGLLGYVFFSHNVELLGATMLFAAGGILYLIFQDIAPQSHMRRHWGPPLGAVMGFCVGMLGNNLVVS